jgi:chromosome segregation protein
MKIKKISIFGFKSFMDRLELNFPLGISGIVGPNGCGKSNIVDAIRWCMGEQSPKQLRGRQMEDVIFSGAGEFKSLGMAEVSLLFENGNGSFPPAFSNDPEISVTRRLYRSGESEYLINSVPCRLKDIYEIFMDTGLGNKAYSIIGQGRIGAILEQKPEETRVMLEEAAGITKYRKKVEASEKKIELTQTNLQRVEDVLGEVERQMRSLKRQAAKARRYKSLSEEIQSLELSLYANSYQQLETKSGERLQCVEDLNQQELARSTTFSSLQARIEGMALSLEEKDEALAALRKEYMNAREKVHRKEAELESLAGEMKMQEELETRLAGEKLDIRKRLSGLQEERERLKRKIAETEEACAALEEEIALAEKRLQARGEFNRRIKAEYEKARSEVGEETNREVGLNHESGYLNRMIDQITDSRSRLEKELSEIRVKTETLLKVFDRKSLAREASVERLAEIEEQIRDETLRCEELEQIKKRSEAELKAAEADLNLQQSRLASLQSLSDNFEGYKIGVRTIMKAEDFEPRTMGHILGLVADVIDVDSRYEQAVEAVLSDKLQYVIVESQEDGKRGVEYLKEKAKGRSSFIPLKDLSQNGARKTNPPPFPFLRDLIKVQKDYRPLIDTLLGDTVLLENLEEAIAEWRKNGKDLSFVTPDGDLVDQKGVLSGGRLSRHSGGLLGRKREIEELKSKVLKHKETVKALAGRVDHIQMELQERRQALDASSEEKWSRQGEINELDKMVFRLGQELDQLQKLSQRIAEDLERKDKEHKKQREQLARIQEELLLCRAKRQQEEEYFRKKELELKESEKEYDQFREEVTKLKGDNRILSEERRSLLRELERLENYADESEERLKKIEEDISLGQIRREERQKKRKQLNEELDSLQDRLQQAEEIVSRADRERQAFQNQIKEEESKADQLRRELEELRETINRAKMEQSEIRFKMDSLAEMVKEKFNLDLGSVYRQHRDENFSSAEVQGKLDDLKRLRQQLGEVNLTAIKEHEALQERREFIRSQREDLVHSIESLKKAIQKINRTSLEKFLQTFEEVDRKLKEIFPILFNGGSAGLKMTDETRPLDSGVLVEVQPPGKKLSHMGLLSGGEKALVAMALLFAIYMIRPSPFCLLDEVDAPLDEANIDRFNDLLREIKRFSQIIMVTHNRRSMEIADRLYGVTMEKAGVSKIVAVDLHNVERDTPVSSADPSYSN